ncbi:probable pectinesterase/pectinesterase inhibitor 20 [Rosa rugosa]|uniref:probable pectinesterase/pectinesterase inhibitor 20 n=1 Tax=Rosa rugosa TaxID=74645 RepID=UPI002B413B70|nr:probable pectinesterase/pectinesterase inhibitor 20 [Rosa rugosa]
MGSQPFSVFKLSTLILHLIPILFASRSLAAEVGCETDPVSKEIICEFTPNPSYCKSMLPNQTNNVYDYGRYAVRKSLSQSHKLLNLVNKYLQRNSTLSKTAILALEDCKLLAELNVDFLASSLQTLNDTNRTLPSSKAEDVHTWLSAVLTNQQTCLDGVQATSSSSSWRSMKNGLLLSNNTNLYSVSLALFTKGWVPENEEDEEKEEEGEVITWRKRLLQNFGDVLVRETVTVSQDGSGNFTTITDAVAAAPVNTKGLNGYFLIYIKAGVYEEYVNIANTKNYLMMIGEGINQTVITGNRSVVDGWTTFNSATFVVIAPWFVAVNITFRNTAGAIKHQAVAVRNGGDLSAFYNCSFEGYQDTLYTHSQRQFYRDCNVYGTVDFIFGNAAAVFQKCNIYPRLPMRGQFNAITAQGRADPNQNTGIMIHNCTIRASDDLASDKGTTRTYLGRPWKEYSRTVYMKSFMDGCIDREGWSKWTGDFALSTLYYAEYKCQGPGSNTSRRVTWPGYHILKKAKQAKKFTVSKFLLGKKWLPQTGVPFSGGLI